MLLPNKVSAQSWTADNGNGTYTNPLFYDECSDPDIIRVGEYFYMTGTTMHSMPGLAIYRSRDLVNWYFLTYVFESLELGPEFRLENGMEEYGQGIWHLVCVITTDISTFFLMSTITVCKSLLPLIPLALGT